VSSVADSMANAGFAVGWSAVKRMPERAAYGTFERIADTMWARHGSSVKRLESNLRRVVGPEMTDD